MTSQFRRSVALLSTALTFFAVSPVQAQVIGTAGAANTRTTGTPPGKGVRTIEIGTQVVHNEKIETSASGSLHVIFIDKTTLNVGPNSTLVINEFVYNPNTGAGSMAATLTRGVMRIVGGQVTHTGGAQIRTPTATIGVRGGVATIRHCATTGAGCSQVGTRAINHFGVLTAASGGGVETISRPGFGTFISGVNAPPVSPNRVAQNEINLNNSQLTSQGGARGGSARPPTDQQAQRGGLGQTNAGATPLNIVPLQQQTGSGQPPQQGQVVGPTDLNNQVQQGAQQAATTAASTATANPAKTFVLTTTAGAGSRVPFLTASFVGSGSFNVSQVYGYKPENETTSSVMQASLNINGSGTGQTSTLSLMTGLTGKPSTANSYLMGGGFAATSLLASNQIPLRAAGAVTSTGAAGEMNAVPVDSTGVPTGPFNVSQNEFRRNDIGSLETVLQNAYQTGTQTEGYTFGQTFSLHSSTTAAARTSQTLVGYTGGLVGAAGSFLIASNSGGDRSGVSISNYASGQLSASFRQQLSFQATDGQPVPVDFLDLNFRFGTNPDGTTQKGRGVAIDSRIFGAQAEYGAAGSSNPFGPTTTFTLNFDGTSTSINPTRDNSFMVSSDAVNAASFFPGVKFCVCDYTRWGFWSPNTSFQDPLSAEQAILPSHIMRWVAGVPAAQVDIPTVGSATYSGHVIATLARGDAQYLAASNLNASVNFGTGAASMTVADLDGFKYSGSRTQTAGAIPVTFQTTLSGLPVSASAPAGVTPTMYLNGGFFKSAASPVGSIAGTAVISAPLSQNYLGAGIFAAQQ